jgi:hypothetical protein
MAFDPTPMPGGGGDPYEAWCSSCRNPITGGQRKVRVTFNTDPHGHKGLTGDYHAECSKPFESLARVVNMNPFGGF